MIDLLDIVGQDSCVESLERMLQGSRRPHALLMVGPQGVGRRTTAVAFARALLCEKPVSRPNSGRFPSLGGDFALTQACGQCVDCRMMTPRQAADGAASTKVSADPLAALSHPDFHLVYKELAAFHEDPGVRSRVMQELGIDVVRKFLIEPAGQRAARGRGKVFIVRDADLMSAAAQNAMLKTLEEPPPGVTIVLLAENPDQMLPTTKSRCSLLRLGPLPREFVMNKLRQAGLEERESTFWAAFTDGSAGRALRLAAQKMYPIKQDLVSRIAAMNRAGDAELGELLVETTEDLAAQNVKLTKVGETEMSKNLAIRQGAGVMLEMIASAFRDAMKLSSGSTLPIVNADQLEAVTALSRKFKPTQLASVIEQLSELEELLWRNVNPKTIWDNVVITCASASPLRL